MGRPPDCNCFCTPVDLPDPPELGQCPCPTKGWHEQFQDGIGKERILVMQICNSNSSEDDNMKIILNGTTIDEVLDHNSNSRTGAIYISDSSTTIDPSDSILVCQGESHEQISFDPSILNAYPSNNALTAELVQANNNGNLGHLVIASFPYPYVQNQGCIILENTWADASTWNYQFALCPQYHTVYFGKPPSGYTSYAVQTNVDPITKIYYPGDTLLVETGTTVNFSLASQIGNPCSNGSPNWGNWRIRSPGQQSDPSSLADYTDSGAPVNTTFPYTITADLDIWAPINCIIA